MSAGRTLAGEERPLTSSNHCRPSYLEWLFDSSVQTYSCLMHKHVTGALQPPFCHFKSREVAFVDCVKLAARSGGSREGDDVSNGTGLSCFNAAQLTCD